MTRKKLVLYLLTSSLLLQGCVGKTRKNVDENEINSTNEYVKVLYESEDMDYSKKQTKVFAPYEHNLMKIVTAFAYDEFLQIEGPENYVLSVRYGETTRGNGHICRYIVCTFVNTVPVEATGYWDNKKQEYVYTTPGVALEESNQLKLTK